MKIETKLRITETVSNTGLRIAAIAAGTFVTAAIVSVAASAVQDKVVSNYRKQQLQDISKELQK
mgnify:FL=1